MPRLDKNTFLLLLLGVVITNYIAQIPYYIHQYYLPNELLPSLYGTVLLSLTLVWFLIAYKLLHIGRKRGWVLMLLFLSAEFLFYLQTQILQGITSHQILLHVYHPKGLLLFIVFGIGYINFIASVYFILYLARNKTQFVQRKDG